MERGERILWEVVERRWASLGKKRGKKRDSQKEDIIIWNLDRSPLSTADNNPWSICRDLAPLAQPCDGHDNRGSNLPPPIAAPSAQAR
ncbi:hypothetical protein BaRGS_00012414 [Batillaria attramentaria]|uniref:Uncharacterized protein n=1 Tax=Batillaria attramentaria TaxID=370345 RepID=A0ABD0LA04_9CAEN